MCLTFFTPPTTPPSKLLPFLSTSCELFKTICSGQCGLPVLLVTGANWRVAKLRLSGCGQGKYSSRGSQCGRTHVMHTFRALNREFSSETLKQSFICNKIQSLIYPMFFFSFTFFVFPVDVLVVVWCSPEEFILRVFLFSVSQLARTH